MTPRIDPPNDHQGGQPTSARCGWNGCTKPGQPEYDDRCGDHEYSQCRTEGCTENADDGEGFDGFCGNCADREEAAGRWS
ncbi:hypothetical protein B5P44_00470 [Mycobacterium sp. CBMA 213]|uniref:Uncharacterized protein n=2 Tax=Mycolicibacterium sp. CBMA 213 TaxID=1968788 RepID=A0A343VR74_9MYCO|nr:MULTISPECIES: hypothetical protein [unclassified Mycolicibacterium]AVN58398.1 hypothetical protein B5P44_p00103 [Mycolicibacterium sp. CBMA 213]MUL61058.1 hypothetical protein [Mycolicibacterium sp. CBMA 335]MUM03297.1 hypothetical protein [Mycolicibacterium sp. CBMA 213]